MGLIGLGGVVVAIASLWGGWALYVYAILARPHVVSLACAILLGAVIKPARICSGICGGVVVALPVSHYCMCPLLPFIGLMVNVSLVPTR